MNGFARHVPFLFEFNDLSFVPQGLRTTLHEVLQLVCAHRVVDYYSLVAEQAAEVLKTGKITRFVELGAGHAPITKELAAKFPNVDFVLYDLFPDHQAFRQLETTYANVQPRYEPLDYVLKTPEGDHQTMFVMASTFHHVCYTQREQLIISLLKGGATVFVAEPLRCDWFSFISTFLSFVLGLTLPLQPASLQTRLRRVAWCWLLPFAPLCLCWDGIVSCLRQPRLDSFLRLARRQHIKCRFSYVNKTSTVIILEPQRP